MRSKWVLVMAPLAAGLMLTSPAAAKTSKAQRQAVTCDQIQAALGSGKKPAEVAKELKISVRRVTNCEKTAAKQH